MDYEWWSRLDEFPAIERIAFRPGGLTLPHGGGVTTCLSLNLSMLVRF